MEEIIKALDKSLKALDKNLEYVSSRVTGDTIEINVKSTREAVECPFCGRPSSRVHSRKPRIFQDLPVMGYKVRIVLEGRKMFCDNCECDHTTFSERFDFLPSKARKTARLTKHILDTAAGSSSVTAAKTLRSGTCEIGKSTICAMIKKNGRD